MSKLPKLKLKMPSWYPEKELIYDMNMEEVNKLIHAYGRLIVEHEVINAYDELVKLVAQDCYKDKEFIEGVVIIPAAGG